MGTAIKKPNFRSISEEKGITYKGKTIPWADLASRGGSTHGPPNAYTVGLPAAVYPYPFLFGVEIECETKKSNVKAIGHGRTTDGSVSGWEYYTGVLGGKVGMESLAHFVHTLYMNGEVVRKNCGTHVHFSNKRFYDAEFLLALRYFFRLRVEDMVMKYIKPEWRKRSYARGFNFSGSAWSKELKVEDYKDYKSMLRQMPSDMKEKGQLVACGRLSSSSMKSTIEVRAFHATTNYWELYHWIMLWSAIFMFVYDMRKEIIKKPKQVLTDLTVEDVFRHSMTSTKATQMLKLGKEYTF